MDWAMAILEVEISEDGDPLWSLLGPALIAAAAVIAATVAARTANSRQREQLAHDRALRAREHIRDTVDAAADRAIAALEAFTDFEVEIDENERIRSEQSELLASEHASLEEKVAARKRLRGLVEESAAAGETASARAAEVIATQARLRLRLGVSDPIVICSKVMAEKFVDLEVKLGAGLDQNRSDEEIASAKEADKVATRAFRQFMSTCEAWFMKLSEEPKSAKRWRWLRTSAGSAGAS
jgi:hypothetical protein